MPDCRLEEILKKFTDEHTPEKPLSIEEMAKIFLDLYLDIYIVCIEMTRKIMPFLESEVEDNA